MNQQMGLTDFFAMEAGEYLERLDELVSGRGKPNMEEVLRLARALRGSALMASQQTISNTAAALERLIRIVREDRVPWDEATKQLSIRAVDDLKVLVRGVRGWSDAHEQRAQRIRQELERVAGPPTGLTGQHAAIKTDTGLDTGTRAFIGREGASVASALDQAAKALQQNPLAHDPLTRVLKVMQPLRGLAVLSELPPVPDLLEGIEQAIGELQRRHDPVPDAALLFNAAAKAVSRSAQEIATHGSANPDSAEAQDFAKRLGRLIEGDAVPIQSLYFNDQGPHVVEQGAAPSRPGRLGQVELVSHGEHLQKAADELERAQSQTQRALRAQALTPTFRALAGQTGGPLADAVADFAQAARNALARGTAAAQAEQFAKHLRTVGKVLSTAGQEDESSAAGRVKAVAVEILGAPRGAAAAPPGRPTSAAEAAAAPPRRPTPTAGAAEPGRSAEAPTLAGSWTRYERLVAERGLGPASLDELVKGAPRAQPVPSVPSAPPASPASPASSASPAGQGMGEEVVHINSLLYSGSAALERADELRQEVHVVVSGPTIDRTKLTDLIEEFFDLVELGIEK
jgi:chemotaxis protein histidine kinase CheA